MIGPPPGGDVGPFAFTGFSVASEFPFEPSISDEPPCGADQCLAIFISPLFDPGPFIPQPPVTATFSAFADGTTSFGVRLPGGHPSLTIIIRGGGETTLAVPAGDGTGGASLAIFDPSGLESVEILGTQYFDEVITSQIAPIPLPQAGAALLAALGGLLLFRRRAS